MDPGTSSFEDWLSRLELECRGRDLRAALESVSAAAARDFGARLWFVEILGRRWSYFAGVMAADAGARPALRRPLAAGMGLVIDDFGRLDPGRLDLLALRLDRLIATARATARAEPSGAAS